MEVRYSHLKENQKAVIYGAAQFRTTMYLPLPHQVITPMDYTQSGCAHSQAELMMSYSTTMM